jgi:hypothetical protein
MLRSPAPLLFAAVLSTACSERPAAVAPDAANDSATAIAALKAEVTRLQQENAELRATPAVMLAAVHAAGSDIAKASEALTLLEEKFPDAAETKQANTLVAQMKSEHERREAEAKRLAALGFKALKVTPRLAGDEATITLSGVSQTRRWISDAYDSQYHYRDAEKGAAFIVARVKVTSDNKNPGLPGVALYRSEGATLKRVAMFGYEFVRWKDYGSYLGNYSDYGNDFAHTNVIPMSIGADAELASLTRPLYLVATKEGCHSRNYERFRNPPVSYAGGDCAGLKDTLEAGDFGDGKLALVHRLD